MRSAAWALTVAFCSGAIPARADAAGVQVLPIKFHVVQVDGTAVATRTFLDEQLARANQIFAPYGVGFAAVAEVELAAQHAALETRADRDALGRYVARGAIDCFVVGSLRDVDEPERMRHGVHWHVGSRRGAPHFVIVSARAGLDVLAHELGHYLGNPKHSDTPGNLMSYERAEPALPFLDAAQVRRMRAAIRRYLRAGELRLSDRPTS